MAQGTGDPSFDAWLKQQGYVGDPSSGYQTAEQIQQGQGYSVASGVFGEGFHIANKAPPKETLQQLQQQYQSSVQQTASTKAGEAAIAQTAPGQDVFSQKLAGMATGQFSPDDPSYQWRLQQGEQALERSQAAKGNLGSGNILTAITDYAQGAASQEYSAQFTRMLQGSENATKQYTAAYSTLATMMNAQTGQAAQQANASIGGYNATTSRLNTDNAATTSANKSAGAADALSAMYSSPTGAAYWAQQDAQAQQQQQQQQQNYTMSGYQPNATSGTPQGSSSGWFSSSSGSGGTFGDTSSASGFGGA